MLPKEQGETPSDRRIRKGSWRDSDVQFWTNRLIVRLKQPEEDSESAARAMVDRVTQALPTARPLRGPRKTGRMLFAVDPEADVLKLAQELEELDEVEYAEPDIVDHEAVIPSDTRYAEQWGLTMVDAPAAWDIETGDPADVVIGIIDSGISMAAVGGLDHPDLNDAGRYILGIDYVDGGTPRDLRGHGTHVTGIAAAESNNAQGIAGMNWGCKVYVCRTLDSFGNGSSADFADAVEEIVDYAVANGLKAVINYSAGGGANLTKQNACQYVEDHGMILCAATGNDFGGPVIFPAAYSTMFDGVIGVGSTDDDDTVSNFSNVGPEVTVVAPGRDILSTMPTYSVTIPGLLNYDELNGTSMATPFVSGLAALMWSRQPGATNTKIRNCITGTATKLGAGTFDNAWGNGRIEAEKALKCLFPVFTYFTLFTSFTRFTLFTRFTYFTRFTLFTLFTLFTRFSPFTAFTRFGPHIPRRPDPPDIEVRPFVRVGGLTFDPEELRVEKFRELQAVRDALDSIGIHYLHELAAADAAHLAKSLSSSESKARALVDLSRRLIEQVGRER